MRINHLRDTVAGKPMDVQFNEIVPVKPLPESNPIELIERIKQELGLSDNIRNINGGQLPTYNKG